MQINATVLFLGLYVCIGELLCTNMPKWLAFICLLPSILSTASAQSVKDLPSQPSQSMAPKAVATCPFTALLSENVQKYQKAYAEGLLKALQARPTFSDEHHTITPRELMKPMYDYMVSNHWPTAETRAIYELMDAPPENFAGCFPELAQVLQPLQQVFEKEGADITQLRKDTERGSVDAQTKLGNIYFRGQGVAKDYRQALALWHQAADQGGAEAEYNIGYMYRNGFGVSQDYHQALAWFRKAADQGWGEAQTSLGFMYAAGLGTAQDYQQAFTWYSKAADQGVAAAQHSLGMLYEHGNGVPRDIAQALAWYRKAAEQGYEESKAKVSALTAPQAPIPTVVTHDPPAGVQLPNQWVYDDMFMTLLRSSPYFQCNYTTKTCLSGRAAGNEFFGEVLAEDRKTVLAHVHCRGEYCINYDTGLDNRGVAQKDLPKVCVDVYRDLHEICDLRPVAIGSRWMISPGVIRCSVRTWDFSAPTCYEGDYEEVVVDKVDAGAQACVHVQVQLDCFWVSKNALSGPLADRPPSGG